MAVKAKQIVSDPRELKFFILWFMTIWYNPVFDSPEFYLYRINFDEKKNVRCFNNATETDRYHTEFKRVEVL